MAANTTEYKVDSNVALDVLESTLNGLAKDLWTISKIEFYDHKGTPFAVVVSTREIKKPASTVGIR